MIRYDADSSDGLKRLSCKRLIVSATAEAPPQGVELVKDISWNRKTIIIQGGTATYVTIMETQISIKGFPAALRLL